MVGLNSDAMATPNAGAARSRAGRRTSWKTISTSRRMVTGVADGTRQSSPSASSLSRSVISATGKVLDIGHRVRHVWISQDLRGLAGHCPGEHLVTDRAEVGMRAEEVGTATIAARTSRSRVQPLEHRRSGPSSGRWVLRPGKESPR